MQESMTDQRNCFLDLPQEILHKIFVECLPTRPEWRTLSSQYAPILLMHVCSSWRKTALDCSTLWKNVSLGDVKSLAGTGQAQFLRIQSQILEQTNLWRSARKGTHISLSLSFADPNSFFPGGSGAVPMLSWSEHIKATIVDHVEMLHKLRLHFRLADDAAFFELPTQKMAELECLEISAPSFQEIIQATANIRRARSLRRFKLNVTHRVNAKISSFPHWPQLTHFVLTGHRCPTLHLILQNCPNLQQLSTMVDQNDFSLKNGPITPRHLAHFSITFSCFSDSSFFEDIYLPALTHFRLSCDADGYPDSFSWNISDKSSSNVHFTSQLQLLQTLVLAYSDIDGDSLLELLRFTPNLLKLVVDSVLKTYGSFLNGLTYQPGKDGNIIPKLQYFTLYIDTIRASMESSFEEEARGLGGALFEMAMSRAGRIVAGARTLNPNSRPQPLRKVLLCYEEYHRFTEIISTSTSMSPTTALALKDVDFSVAACNSGDKSMWAADEFEFW